MPEPTQSTDLADEARRHDPDRWLCALFAAADRRGEVMALVDDHGTMGRALLASGQLAGFRAWIGHAQWVEGGEAAGLFLPRGEAEAVGVKMGDKVRHVGF